MTLSIRIEPDDVVEVRAQGKLTRDDYRVFVPEMERLMKKDRKLRILFEMEDFGGWEAGALWEDLKFDVKHHDDIERLALVGNEKWQKWMATVCKPFTSAKVKYFSEDEKSRADNWIRTSAAAG